jgi:hypothetical protein
MLACRERRAPPAVMGRADTPASTALRDRRALLVFQATTASTACGGRWALRVRTDVTAGLASTPTAPSKTHSTSSNHPLQSRRLQVPSRPALNPACPPPALLPPVSLHPPHNLLAPTRRPPPPPPHTPPTPPKHSIIKVGSALHVKRCSFHVVSGGFFLPNGAWHCLNCV